MSVGYFFIQYLKVLSNKTFFVGSYLGNLLVEDISNF